MFLRKTFSYTSSFKVHSLIAGILGSFVLFILFFLKPFDTGTSNFPYKNAYFLGYGIITFISYIVVHFSSTIYYKRVKTWRFFQELFFCLAFVSITILAAFYYTEIGINKKPERTHNLSYLFGWFKIVFLGFGVLLICITFFLRSKLTKPLKKSPKKVKLYGSLKKESIFLDMEQLVYIKSENNYVTVYYFEDDVLKNKLLRSTLTNINRQVPLFLKVHRSYIVNKNFILNLKGNKQNAKLYLKDIDYQIPVSTTFFDVVQEATKSK